MSVSSRRIQSPAESNCPCDSGRPYAQCCGPLHTGAPAPDAAALMRSRYSAYVRELEPYLLASWHPTSRPPHLEFEPKTKWLGLKVIRHELLGDSSPDEAIVEFVARYRIGSQPAVRLHEISRFVQENGHWFYIDGELL